MVSLQLTKLVMSQNTGFKVLGRVNGMKRT
jgi:hypothetical protein